MPEKQFYETEEIYCELVEGCLSIAPCKTLLTDAPPCNIPNLAVEWAGLDITQVYEVIIADTNIHTYNINAEAFTSFINMKSITIAKAVTAIQKDAFNIIRDSLVDVYFTGSLQDWYNINFATESANPMFKAEHLYLKNASGEVELLTELDLTNLDLTSSDNTIKSNRLIYLSDITTLKLPESAFSIADYAFCGCSALEILDVPRSCTAIGTEAFRDCTNLQHVYITKNVIIEINGKVVIERIKLGRAVFLNCLDVKIHFEDNKAAFAELSSYWDANWALYAGPESVTIPASSILCNINSYAYKFTGTTETGLCWGQDYNNKISIIGYDAELLYKAPDTEPVANIISNNWESVIVGKDAYNRDICEYFLRVAIPEKINGCDVTTITKYAFSECHKASIIVIPTTITNIEDFAFYRCGNIRYFEVSPGNSNYASLSVAGTSGQVITLACLVNKNKTELIRYCTGSTESTFTIPNGITTVGTAAFESSIDLEHLMLDAITCTTFKRDAFYDCTNLKSIQFTSTQTAGDPLGWTAWARITFENAEANPATYAKKLISASTAFEAGNKNIQIASITGSIKDYAFNNVKKLYNMWQNGSVIQVSDTAINKINITDADTIGKYAFAKCLSCQYLTLPNTVISIAEHAFAGCSKLLTIYYNGSFQKWCDISFANEFSNPYYYDINRVRTSSSNYQLTLDYKKNIFSAAEDKSVAWLTDSVDIKTDETGLDANTKVIPDCTFINCELTKSESANIFQIASNTLTIGSGITNLHIGRHAFENVQFNTAITTLSIPKGQSIGYCAFRGTNIPSLIIDAADISIDDYAFANLKAYGTLNITTNAANLQLGDNCFLGANYSKIKTLAKYLSAIDLSNCTDLTIIADGTEGVKDLFGGATKLQKLAIEGTSDSLTELLDTLTSETFKYCPNLAELQVNKIKDRRIFKKFFTDQNCLFKRDGDNNILVLGCNGFANVKNRTVDAIPNVIIADRAFAYRKFGTTAGGDITEQLPALPKETISIGREIFYNVTVDDSASSTSNS